MFKKIIVFLLYLLLVQTTLPHEASAVEALAVMGASIIFPAAFYFLLKEFDKQKIEKGRAGAELRHKRQKNACHWQA